MSRDTVGISAVSRAAAPVGRDRAVLMTAAGAVGSDSLRVSRDRTTRVVMRALPVLLALLCVGLGDFSRAETKEDGSCAKIVTSCPSDYGKIKQTDCVFI